MKKSLDEHLHETMNKEQEMPEVVKTAFQNSYSMIRTKAKKKNGKRWIKPVSAAAACAVLASGLVFSNNSAFANLQAFFGFKDVGIELATQNGDTKYSGITQKDQNVTITLENTFADAYRVGLQLGIVPTELNVKDIADVQVEFRLKDSTGMEVAALAPENQPINELSPISGIEMNMIQDTEESITTELLLQSNALQLPSLDNSELVIERIHFSTHKEGIITVDGNWTFKLSPTKVQQQSFVANNDVKGLHLDEATISNGSMHVSVTIDELLDENVLLDISLKDQDGVIYTSSGANVSRESNQTTVNLVFPYSVWNEQQKLALSIKGYDDILLLNK